eukprot:101886-Karenia_brevis.AAC.1
MIKCPRDEENERDEEEDEFPDLDMIREMTTQFREVRRPNKREKKIRFNSGSCRDGCVDQGCCDDRWICGVEDRGKKM